MAFWNVPPKPYSPRPRMKLAEALLKGLEWCGFPDRQRGVCPSCGRVIVSDERVLVNAERGGPGDGGEEVDRAP